MSMTHQKKYSQYFTPVWAAEILFNEHFSHLTNKDLVWEPSCGAGSMLSAIPKHIPAIGSDIDPDYVKIAGENTGRSVYEGDFCTINFSGIDKITAMFGNPPFSVDVFEQLMQRCETILAKGNKAGFILPAYFFQTSATFMRFARKWDIEQQIIPRDLFEGPSLLTKPLVFATFMRDDFPKLFGFRLHAELCDVKALKSDIRDILNHQVKRNGSVWKEVLIKVVRDNGGTVTLNQVYKNMEGKRPTENPFWKEQVRKLIQQNPFQRVDDATYQLIN